MKIGYLGLGHMGALMAANIAKKKDEGDTLYVWNRTASKMDPLVALGAVATGSPAELAQKCDLIFMCLSGPHEVDLIVGGEDGLIANGHDGLYIVDMSTSSQELAEELAKRGAEKGIKYIDMPVSGGVYRSEEGTLSFMFGGTEEDAKPILKYIMMIGDKITYLGKPGLGAVAKLIHNATSLTIQLMDAEALLMADYAGIPADAMFDVIQKGGASSVVFGYHGPRALKRDEEGGHDVVLAVKDLELCAEMARKLGCPTFTLSEAIQWYKYAVLKGKAHKDSSSLINVIRDEFAPNNNIEVYDL